MYKNSVKNLLPDNVRIQDGQLVLRKVMPDEADSLNELVDNPAVYRYLPTYLEEKKDGDSRQFMERSEDSLFLGVFEEGQFAGLMELYGYRKLLHKVSIGCRLTERCWGRGISTRSTNLLVQYLFHETKINVITASTMVENHASANVLKKAGFSLVMHNVPENWGYETPTRADKWILWKYSMRDERYSPYEQYKALKDRFGSH